MGGTLITSLPQTLSHRQWGTAFEFEISDFTISSATPNDGIFTTMDSEKNITLTLEIPDYMDPASIWFSVLETVENHTVTITDGVIGNNKKFDISHEGLQSLTTPASHVLVKSNRTLSLENFHS